MNKKPPDLMKAEIEGVSLLKPLKGVDPNLEDNLETFFELDYPQVNSPHQINAVYLLCRNVN